MDKAYNYIKYSLNMLRVTALTLRVVMARLSIHVCMSTDLTPKRRVYIDRLTSYIVPHTTSFVNDTQYLVPRRNVL